MAWVADRNFDRGLYISRRSYDLQFNSIRTQIRKQITDVNCSLHTRPPKMVRRYCDQNSSEDHLAIPQPLWAVATIFRVKILFIDLAAG